ncbi:MAG: FAD-dependent oxidoreductase, partial [Planctomycetota bacterium]
GMVSDADCIVVGAGLAGLACARTLQRAGRRVLVLEAADRVGGRVATDTVAGFRVDRGFQVYNDAYPEGRRQLDLEALRLGRFDAGALVAEHGRLRRVADPWRQPLAAVAALLSGTVGMGDAVRTARLRRDAVAAVRSGRLDPDAPAGAERTTAEELAARGFSAAFVQRFFVPFFGGVFLERSLDTAASVFLFDFAMFALGRASLPAGGMAAIPAQLAAGLPSECLRLECAVAAVAPGVVELARGDRLAARDVVVATDRAAAARLLPPEHRGGWGERRDKATRLVAFAADRSPLASPTLVVSADAVGPIDNLTVPSDIAAGYAPAGAALVTVSVRDGFPEPAGGLAAAVRDQAAGWFGGQTGSWRELATVHVRHALPDESPAARRLRPAAPRLAEGLWLCGDHCGSASINGALVSGRKAAEAILGG